MGLHTQTISSWGMATLCLLWSTRQSAEWGLISCLIVTHFRPLSFLPSKRRERRVQTMNLTRSLELPEGADKYSWLPVNSFHLNMVIFHCLFSILSLFFLNVQITPPLSARYYHDRAIRLPIWASPRNNRNTYHLESYMALDYVHLIWHCITVLEIVAMP